MKQTQKVLYRDPEPPALPFYEALIGKKIGKERSLGVHKSGAVASFKDATGGSSTEEGASASSIGTHYQGPPSRPGGKSVSSNSQ
jgi:hypothetical protein